MAFITLTWEANEGLATADKAVEDALVQAGADLDEVVWVLLRTVLLDEDGIDTNVLLDALDDSVSNTTLMRYWIATPARGIFCGGHLAKDVDIELAREIASGGAFPFER
jgi:hypothetical protein